MMIKTFSHFIIPRLWLAASLVVIGSTACQPSPAAEVTPSVTQTTPTASPSPTPTREPIGSPLNPPTLGMTSAGDDPQDQIAATAELAGRLSSMTGYAVDGVIYPSYGDLIAALRAGAIHIVWLPPLTYLLANQEDLVEPVFITNRFGVYYYGTQFLANANSGFSVYFDPAANRNTADAAAALQQFAGKMPCWIDPGSLSGYILPAGLLAENNIPVEPGASLLDHTAVVRALYVRDICDFGVTFAFSGDPRTASAVQDLPAVMDQIVVIWRSEAVIPNLTLAMDTKMDEDMRGSLSDALLDLAASVEGKRLLSRAIGDDIQGAKRIADSDFDRLRELVETAVIDLNSLIGK